MRVPLKPLKLGKNSMVGTRCGGSATVNPTRTRSTASLPDHVYTTNRIFFPGLGRGEPKSIFAAESINRLSMELTKAKDEKQNVEARQPRHNCQQREMWKLWHQGSSQSFACIHHRV